MRAWVPVLISSLWCAAFAGCSPPPPDVAPAPTSSASSKEDIPPEAATGVREGLVSTRATKHMVGAANPHASRAGQEVLRAGGSAVDAAIAMALVLTLVEPQSSGIGGGAFMLHFDASTQSLVTYDGRETAPASATPDMFLNKDGTPRDFFDAVVGGLSVGVPGELRMLEMAHREQGKLPWKRLFEPAIRLARAGFDVSPRLFGLLEAAPHLGKMRATKAYFFDASGKPKAVGTKIQNVPLAETLEAVAAGGADAFYAGPIAQDIARAASQAERNPGRLTAADLAGYKAVKRAPICRIYRKSRVCGMPPPTSGGITTLQILGLLERFDLRGHEAGSVMDVHLFAEAGKLAYADRDVYIGDPDFVDVPVTGLLDFAYLAKRSRLIAPGQAMKKAKPGDVAGASAMLPDATRERPSTSHVVVVDGEGNAVSMTASIEGAFGSHVMVRGFLLNNELTDFSFVPERDGVPVRNRVQPNKRPRSSMAPIIVLDEAGGLQMLVGSPGGSRIIGYVARALIAVIDHQLDVQEAIGAPNFLNRNGVTEIEDVAGPWSAATRVGLVDLGHEVRVGPLNSGLQAILRVDGGLVGGADPRREGLILGD